MNINFERIAPYLKDPLVLIGLFMFLAFLFSRFLIKKGIIKPLPQAQGYQILRLILLYGFIIGLLIIILGFALKHRELDNQRKTAESIASRIRNILNDAASLSEEKKNEIINQIVKGYLDGALSREQIEVRVEEIKTSLARNALESTPSRTQASSGFNTNPKSTSPKLTVWDQLNNPTETRKDKENRLVVIPSRPEPFNDQVSSSSVVLPPSESYPQQEQPTPQQERVAPQIDSISPRTLTSLDLDQNVTVFGNQFNPGLTVRATSPDGRTTFSSNQIRSVTSTSFVMAATFDKLGSWTIRVYNPDGGRSNKFRFFVRSAVTPPASDIFCGNGRVEWPEQCDDGNNLDGDGCSKDCQIETISPSNKNSNALSIRRTIF